MHSVPAIAAMLAERIEQLAPELLPGGRRVGVEWRCGSIAGEQGQSLAVRLQGAKRGVWCDFVNVGDPRNKGDALDLVAQTRFGGDKREALRWSRAWLGLEAFDRNGYAERAPVAPVQPAQTSDHEEMATRRRARALWLEAVPITGTPAADYLAARGLPLEGLGRAPGALRFHPRLFCAETGGHLPGMVAAIVRDGKHVATHRTFLAQDRGRWGKARLESPKKVMGRFGGGIIPLWRGATGRPFGEFAPGEVLAAAEGIEDTLTVAWHQPEWRAAASVSLGNMAAMVLPAAAQELVLVFDRDGENEQARIARQQAVRAHQAAGRIVRETRPIEGHKDMNAWHQAMGFAGETIDA